MSTLRHLSQLEKDIEKLREKMIKQATEKGRLSDESIEASQELDQLINEYIELQRKLKD